MTQHKKLKQLIRSRKAKTGESYTTARRHVLAKAAGSAAGQAFPAVVAGYPAFGAGQCCATTHAVARMSQHRRK